MPNQKSYIIIFVMPKFGYLDSDFYWMCGYQQNLYYNICSFQFEEKSYEIIQNNLL